MSIARVQVCGARTWLGSFVASCLFAANANAQVARDHGLDLLQARDAIVAASPADRPQVRADVAVLMALNRERVEECEPTLDLPRNPCAEGNEPGMWDALARELANHAQTEPALLTWVAEEIAYCDRRAAIADSEEGQLHLYDAWDVQRRNALYAAFEAGGRARTAAAFQLLAGVASPGGNPLPDFQWDLVSISPEAIAVANRFRHLLHAAIEHLTTAEDPLARAVRGFAFSLEDAIYRSPVMFARARDSEPRIVMTVSDNAVHAQTWPTIDLTSRDQTSVTTPTRTLIASGSEVDRGALSALRDSHLGAVSFIAETTSGVRLLEAVTQLARALIDLQITDVRLVNGDAKVAIQVGHSPDIRSLFEAHFPASDRVELSTPEATGPRFPISFYDPAQRIQPLEPGRFRISRSYVIPFARLRSENVDESISSDQLVRMLSRVLVQFVMEPQHEVDQSESLVVARMTRLTAPQCEGFGALLFPSPGSEGEQDGRAVMFGNNCAPPTGSNALRASRFLYGAGECEVPRSVLRDLARGGRQRRAVTIRCEGASYRLDLGEGVSQ